MTEEYFIKELNRINIKLSEDQLTKLNHFYELLIEWNKKLNLTTITKKEDVYLKHFYDSLTLIKVVDLNKDLKVLDIGTGAGFPGIVLKIVFPNLKITLLDSLQKRIKYINEIIKELNLKNIETICERAEIYTKNHREEYDIVVSRAVANLKILSEICFAGVKAKGYFISMKGNIENELIESKDIISNLNGKIVEIKEFYLPIEKSIRSLVKIEKIGKTNLKYPRKYFEIKKR